MILRSVVAMQEQKQGDGRRIAYPNARNKMARQGRRRTTGTNAAFGRFSFKNRKLGQFCRVSAYQLIAVIAWLPHEVQ